MSAKDLVVFREEITERTDHMGIPKQERALKECPGLPRLGTDREYGTLGGTKLSAGVILATIQSERPSRLTQCPAGISPVEAILR